jgi:hypothetical protein
MIRKLASYLLVVIVTLVLAEIYHPLAALSSLAQGDCQTFPETGKTVCGKFLVYWQQHGGLAQQGYPITNTFQEDSDLNGQTYTVQYFERAVFEDHPENQPPNDVLLSQLGTFQLKRKYPNGDPSAGPSPTPVPVAPTATPGGGPKLDLIDNAVVKQQFGGTRAIGYVKNTGSVDLGSIQIVATFKDGAGKIVGTADDRVGLMKVGDVYPYSLGSDTDFATDSIQLSYEQATKHDEDFYYRDFTISDTNVVPPSNYGHAKVTGNVKNSGSGTASLTEVYVLVTDAGGHTLDVDSSFLAINTLGPGQSSPFEVDMNVDSVPKFQIFVESFKK